MRREIFSLTDRCVIVPFEHLSGTGTFSCGNQEIDDFFRNEALLYKQELFANTYAFCDTLNGDRIVSMFSVSNGSLNTVLLPGNTRNKFQRIIPNSKRKHSYPATLLGQLGVSIEYKGYNIGSQVIGYIKQMLVAADNFSQSRYLIVDALNEDGILAFYQKNGFKYLYASKDDECIYSDTGKSGMLRTRVMYCDLKQWLLSQTAAN